MDIKHIASVGLGFESCGSGFSLIEFLRRHLGPKDIKIDILYAGICHSDLHTVEGHWGELEFPLIPGHEIIGEVVELGSNAHKFLIGDIVGIGCMIDSCCECESCTNGRLQDCSQAIMTYGSKDWKHDDIITQGGYSTNYVLNENFAIKIPKGADLKKSASLLCAGITTFSPILQADVEEDSIVGVLGLGGLGMMASKYLKALGCTVIAFDINDKEDFADKLDIKFVLIEDNSIDESFNRKFDFIISTIPYNYDLNLYLPLLKYNGTFAIVGLPPYDDCPSISIKDMILKYPGIKILGSCIGGIEETLLCIDFSVKNDIYPEVIEIDPTPEALNEAYLELINGNVEGRYVMDMSKFNKIDKHENGGILYAQEGTYVIKPNDNLLRISEETGIPIDTIIKYNNISDPNKIIVGLTLKLKNDSNNANLDDLGAHLGTGLKDIYDKHKNDIYKSEMERLQHAMIKPHLLDIVNNNNVFSKYAMINYIKKNGRNINLWKLQDFDYLYNNLSKFKWDPYIVLYAMGKESSFNPYATPGTTSAIGLGLFTNDTLKNYFGDQYQNVRNLYHSNKRSIKDLIDDAILLYSHIYDNVSKSGPIHYGRLKTNLLQPALRPDDWFDTYTKTDDLKRSFTDTLQKYLYARYPNFRFKTKDLYPMYNAEFELFKSDFNKNYVK